MCRAKIAVIGRVPMLIVDSVIALAGVPVG